MKQYDFSGARHGALNPLPNSIFTALDLSYLDLDGVNLVVVSTAQEQAVRWAGKGTFGLAQALVKAGAKTVVLASRSIDDLMAWEVITQSHRRFLAGDSVLDALRHAALTLPSHNPDP